MIHSLYSLYLQCEPFLLYGLIGAYILCVLLYFFSSKLSFICSFALAALAITTCYLQTYNHKDALPATIHLLKSQHPNAPLQSLIEQTRQGVTLSNRDLYKHYGLTTENEIEDLSRIQHTALEQEDLPHEGDTTAATAPSIKPLQAALTE